MLFVERHSIFVTPEVVTVPLDPRLGASVMVVTQSLPVADVPEQQRITLVLDDVIDFRCLPDDAMLLAHRA